MLFRSTRAAVWLAATVVFLGGLYLAVREPVVEPPPIPAGNAHMSHSPRNGGVFFMAPDGFHHLEGTLSRADGEFRIYVYDNYTRPMDARRFQARVGTHLLTPSSDGAYLGGLIGPIEGDQPRVTAFIRFSEDRREDRFDFAFVQIGRAHV